MYSITIRILLTSLILNQTVVYSQRFDFNWIFGYAGGKGDTRFGTTKVDFNSGNPIQYFIPEGKLSIYDANASISTIEGRLLFYSNGYELEDSSYVKITNALMIGFKFWESLIANQGVLFLPEDSNNFNLIYINLERKNGKFVIPHIRRILIDINKKINIRDTVFSGEFNDGFLTSCKHANGTDWWILLNKSNNNVFYKILLSKNNKVQIDSQEVGPKVIDGLGQAAFSSNGEYFATIEGISFDEGLFIYLYKFDRCSGNLEFIQSKNFPAKGYSGLSFSPNSKFLYYSQSNLLYQVDLAKSDPLNNPILVDSIADLTPPWGSSFNIHQLGPDGRIYITNGFSNFYQHVINKPNESGKAFDARSNGFMLKTLNDHGISNNPIYRLGPIDGSICDTLGIDNIPWAWWRHEQDTMDYLRFEFTDLSAYEVTEWEWNFGDGSSSTTQHPIHKYKDKGVYEVCLIAKNKNGADTLCRTLNVGITSVDNSSKLIKIEAFPNPCDEYFMINVLDYIPERMMMSLIDLNGKEVLSKRLYEGSNGVDVAGLTQGVYVINLKENDRIVYSDKMVIIRE